MRSSEGSSSRDNFEVHDEITSKGIEGVNESSGFVLFEEKVANPSKTVPRDKHHQKVPDIESQKEGKEPKDSDGGSDHVQSSVHSVLMLAQIKRVKLLQRVKLQIFNFAHFFLFFFF